MVFFKQFVLIKGFVVNSKCSANTNRFKLQYLNQMISVMDNSLGAYLSFEPSIEQEIALQELGAFLEGKEDAFILQGSAGTGKTTLLEALVKHLEDLQHPYQLLAPTGRAAQMMGYKTQRIATTLHSFLYEPVHNEEDDKIYLNLRTVENTPATVFIVDEASMVGDQVSEGDDELFVVEKGLLTTFVQTIKLMNTENKVVFVGDKYQLAPVKEWISGALQASYLHENFGLTCTTIQLTEVLRQKKGSTILDDAVTIRQMMVHQQQKKADVNYHRAFRDMSEAVKAYAYLHEEFGASEVTFIANSNKNVNILNHAVRRYLKRDRKVLNIGELVICNQNWHGNNRQYVASGEIGEIVSIEAMEWKCGLQFADVKLAIERGNGQSVVIATKVLLNTLTNDTGKLFAKQQKQLVEQRKKENALFKIDPMPWNDAFVGAMRLRYGYALTCHKAQGGEWKRVILHPRFFPKDLRWIYTAITRATTYLYTFNHS